MVYAEGREYRDLAGLIAGINRASLHVNNPGISGTENEVTGSGYSRIIVDADWTQTNIYQNNPNDRLNWPYRNDNSIQFTNATGDWGQVLWVVFRNDVDAPLLGIALRTKPQIIRDTTQIRLDVNNVLIRQLPFIPWGSVQNGSDVHGVNIGEGLELYALLEVTLPKIKIDPDGPDPLDFLPLRNSVRSIEESLLSDRLISARLLKVQTSQGSLYLTDASQDIFWNPPGHTGQNRRWSAKGGELAIGAVGESIDWLAQNCPLILVGIDGDLLESFYTDNLMGYPIDVWRASLDLERGIVKGNPHHEISGIVSEEFQFQQELDPDRPKRFEVQTRIVSHLGFEKSPINVSTDPVLHNNFLRLMGFDPTRTPRDTFFQNVAFVERNPLVQFGRSFR